MFAEFFCVMTKEEEPGTEQDSNTEAKLENGFDHNTGTPGILEESRELRAKSEINIQLVP